MQINLSGKTAVVTGGASGIGQAIVKCFVMAGATVHILELNVDGAGETLRMLGEQQSQAIVHGCNVANQQQVETVIRGIAAKGPIHILVNNAGIAHVGNAENTVEADFDRLFQVNVKGVYNCLHAVLPLMKTNGGGVILNMASIAGSLGISDRFAYSMTKGAVLSMTLSVAKDFLVHNIRCNSISPARIHTPFVDGFIAKNYPGKETEIFEKLSKTQPIGRMGKPEEVADLALYLCSDAAAFITGTDYPIDGGYIKLNG